LFNLLAALAVVVTVCVFSFTYINKIGGHLSPGMMVPMKYLYGIMPVSLILCAVCIIIRMIQTVLGEEDRGGDLPEALTQKEEG
jgi:TRAP-type C4-dicarboxylate transport system permease small subunit